MSPYDNVLTALRHGSLRTVVNALTLARSGTFWHVLARSGTLVFRQRWADEIDSPVANNVSQMNTLPERSRSHIRLSWSKLKVSPSASFAKRTRSGGPGSI